MLFISLPYKKAFLIKVPKICRGDVITMNDTIQLTKIALDVLSIANKGTFTVHNMKNHRLYRGMALDESDGEVVAVKSLIGTGPPGAWKQAEQDSFGNNNQRESLAESGINVERRLQRSAHTPLVKH